MIEKEQQSQPKHTQTVVALHSVNIHTIVIGTTNVKSSYSNWGRLEKSHVPSVCKMSTATPIGFWRNARNTFHNMMCILLLFMVTVVGLTVLYVVLLLIACYWHVSKSVFVDAVFRAFVHSLLIHWSIVLLFSNVNAKKWNVLFSCLDIHPYTRKATDYSTTWEACNLTRGTPNVRSLAKSVISIHLFVVH